MRSPGMPPPSVCENPSGHDCEYSGAEGGCFDVDDVGAGYTGGAWDVGHPSSDGACENPDRECAASAQDGASEPTRRSAKLNAWIAAGQHRAISFDLASELWGLVADDPEAFVNQCIDDGLFESEDHLAGFIGAMDYLLLPHG